MSRRKFLKTIGAVSGLLGAGSLLRSEFRESSDSHREAAGPKPAEVGRATPRRQANENATSNADETTSEEAESADYYVAPDGDDSASGTKENPFETLEAAFEAVDAGETIFLRGGVYRFDRAIKLTGVGGTEENRITLAGVPGEWPIFEFDGPTPGGWSADGRDGGGLKFADAEYLTVRNLVVRDSPYLGVEVVSSRHNVFENVETRNNNLTGFGLYDDCRDNVLRDVISVNNFDPQNGGSDADGIQIENSRNNRVVGAKLFHNSDDGLDLWRSRSITVAESMSWENGYGQRGNGNGFKLGGGTRKSGGHEVHRNVAFNNGITGFDYNEAGTPMSVVNNTAWSNEINFTFYDAPHELKNNISYEGEVSLGNAVEHSHNTWDLDIEYPGFVSLLPVDDLFLHLHSGSPCVGAGVDVGLDYAGEAPDLGAYEFRRE